MKIRNGFVSNSSSSSFIVYKSKINKLEEDRIRKYETLEADMYGDPRDWEMIEKPTYFYFETEMDNFDLANTFRQEYGIPIDKYWHSNGV